MRIYKNKNRWFIQGRKTTTSGTNFWTVFNWHITFLIKLWFKPLRKGVSVEVKTKNGIKWKSTACLLVLICMAITLSAQDSVKVQPNRKWLYHSLEGSYIVLNTFDVVLTYQGLSKGAREANPFLKDIIENKPLFISIKTVFTFGALALIRQVRKHDRKTAMIYLIGANILYSLVVANNYTIVMRL